MRYYCIHLISKYPSIRVLAEKNDQKDIFYFWLSFAVPLERMILEFAAWHNPSQPLIEIIQQIEFKIFWLQNNALTVRGKNPKSKNLRNVIAYPWKALSKRWIPVLTRNQTWKMAWWLRNRVWRPPHSDCRNQLNTNV